MKVPINYFFYTEIQEDLTEIKYKQKFENSDQSTEREVLRFIKAYSAIQDARTHTKFMELLKLIAYNN